MSSWRDIIKAFRPVETEIRVALLGWRQGDGCLFVVDFPRNGNRIAQIRVEGEIPASDYNGLALRYLSLLAAGRGEVVYLNGDAVVIDASPFEVVDVNLHVLGRRDRNMVGVGGVQLQGVVHLAFNLSADHEPVIEVQRIPLEGAVLGGFEQSAGQSFKVFLLSSHVAGLLGVGDQLFETQCFAIGDNRTLDGVAAFKVVALSHAIFHFGFIHNFNFPSAIAICFLLTLFHVWARDALSVGIDRFSFLSVHSAPPFVGCFSDAYFIKPQVISTIYKFEDEFFNRLFFSGKHFEKEGRFIILRAYKKEIFARKSGGRGAQRIMQRHLFQNLGEWCLDALEQGCPRWAIPLRKKVNSVGQAAWFGWASGREAA